MGAVTGVVGAAGGLGGFFPPLVMGTVKSATGSYTIGFLLLAAVAVAALAVVARVGDEPGVAGLVDAGDGRPCAATRNEMHRGGGKRRTRRVQ